MERLGEIGRSNENLTEEADGAGPEKFTRVGDADLWKKLEVLDEKAALDEAKADADADEPE